MSSEQGLRRTRHSLAWLDPIEAYRRLAHLQPMLLDGRGNHPEARHAYLALGAAWEARIQGRQLQIRHEDGRIERHDGAGLEHVRTLAQAMHFDVEEAGFTGGLVGYFGYEFLAAIEPTLPVHEATTPDVFLRLCRDAVVFDHRARTACLWSADLPGEDAVLERVEAVLRAWHQGAARSSSSDRFGHGPSATKTALDGKQPPWVDRPALGAGSTRQHPAAAPSQGAAHEITVDQTAPSWSTSLDRSRFEAAVSGLKDKIAAGDLFQANIATRFRAPCTQSPVDLFAHLAAANPSPFMALIEAGDHAVVSCSPEQLLRVEEGTITTRPIAGTRPRREGSEDDAMEEELRSDAKENAEHTMLIDLLRNDVSKVAVPGTVRVPERASIERYRHVMHMVSRVDGDVQPGTDFAHWMAALFPGGTITGAPKHRACLRIHEAEPVARGPYTGSAGYLSWSHNAHWNILIRTVVLQDGHANVHAGSGIVADSDPGREWEEAGHKAQALLESAMGGSSPTVDRVGDVTRHGSWAPAKPRHVPGRRVLVIDNYDSFTHNLADACAALGARVEVVRNDGDWQAAWHALQPTHLILSPGPGRPEDSGATLDALATDVPILGVCLGHQAMGIATGARVEAVAPVHGKQAAIHHEGAGLLGGLPRPFLAARYHSLAITHVPDVWRPTAWLEDGTLMAMEHRERPWHGVQFHPESLCTDGGLEILARFLEIPHGRHRVR